MVAKNYFIVYNGSVRTRKAVEMIVYVLINDNGIETTSTSGLIDYAVRNYKANCRTQKEAKTFLEDLGYSVTKTELYKAKLGIV